MIKLTVYSLLAVKLLQQKLHKLRTSTHEKETSIYGHRFCQGKNMQTNEENFEAMNKHMY
jgi:hypothetical protein